MQLKLLFICKVVDRFDVIVLNMMATDESVGTAVGMGDANYFSRMFRKVEGSSPREYRKQW